MSTEVKEFRENFRAWVKGISGMSTHIGTGDAARLYYGWPLSPPTPPLMTFTMNRTRAGDHPFPNWSGELHLRLHAVKGETLDEIEDLITDWLGSNNVLSTLSDATVNVHHFDGPDVAEDAPTASPEDGSYVFLTRDLTFRFAFTQKGA